MAHAESNRLRVGSAQLERRNENRVRVNRVRDHLVGRMREREAGRESPSGVVAQYGTRVVGAVHTRHTHNRSNGDPKAVSQISAYDKTLSGIATAGDLKEIFD